MMRGVLALALSGLALSSPQPIPRDNSAPQTGTSVIRGRVVSAATGSFEFPNVPPGEYVIGAFRGTEAGWQIVEVNGADVTGLTVQTQPGSTITGRIVFEGGSAPGRTNVNVLFAPFEPDLVPFKGTGPQADTRSDLTFEVRYANGLGRLRPVNVPSGWTLKSIVAGGVDVTDTPMQFGTKDQSLKDVEVVLTNQVTQLEGVVTDAAGLP